jgi:hypothetical protein
MDPEAWGTEADDWDAIQFDMAQALAEQQLGGRADRVRPNLQGCGRDAHPRQGREVARPYKAYLPQGGVAQVDCEPMRGVLRENIALWPAAQGIRDLLVRHWQFNHSQGRRLSEGEDAVRILIDWVNDQMSEYFIAHPEWQRPSRILYNADWFKIANLIWKAQFFPMRMNPTRQVAGRAGGRWRSTLKRNGRGRSPRK